MNPVDELSAIQAISRIKAEYFRCIDAQDWDGLVAVFTPDAQIDLQDAVEPFNPELLHHDPRAFASSNAIVLAGVKTAHAGYMPRIDILNEEEAAGIWSMQDWLWVPEGNPVMPAGRVHGWGHYHDRYRRVGGHWLIAATRLTRIKLEFR